MRSSTALARVLVDELVRCGVTEAVLCPGSRNAPLSLALHAADAAGRLRLHVRIDERTAGFLALGLARRSGTAVPVVCTSGTAAANLHPAVLEASHSGVALLAVTADRPPELVGTGANQTIEQVGLYGRAVRAVLVLGPADGGDGARWRSTVDRAVAAATGSASGDPGPVQLDVPLTEPLVPGPDEPEPPPGRPDGAPWTLVSGFPRSSEENHSRAAVELDPAAPTLVVAGDGSGTRCPPGLPVLAEPSSPLWGASLAAGAWLADSPAVGSSAESGRKAPAGGLRPRQVLLLGRPTLHRGVTRLLADPDVGVYAAAQPPVWTDMAATVRAVGGLPCRLAGDPGFASAWRDADTVAHAAVTTALAAQPWPSGLAVARDVVAALPPGALLVLGSSNPVRDVSLAATPRADLAVLANRGVAGIDGTVSTALGAALVHSGPSYALLGDVTFLHDATGLLLGPAEPRPNLTVVVVNDDGGGIFALLEQGASAHAGAFERVFGTPHHADLAALCAATGTPHTLAGCPEELTAALRPAPGLRVVEVRVDRSDLRGLHARLRAAVAAALS